jgi:hypothetical protein
MMKDPTEAELVQRARNAWDAGESGLNDWERSALADIGKKVVKYRAFASGSQLGLYAKLVAKLEKKASGDPEPENEPVSVSAPGSADYASPSGIAGARY